MNTSRSTRRRLRTVDIFASESSTTRACSEIRDFVKSLFPNVKVAVKLSPLRGLQSREISKMAYEIAYTRVKDISSPVQTFEPMAGEVDYESRALRGEAHAGGVVYDGRLFADLLLRNCCVNESVETASIVFTDRLVSTFSRDDLRHHLRTVVCAFPSVISVPGIVEAPARPREYYIIRQRLGLEGVGALQSERLKTLMKKRFIDYGDPRSKQVMKGLALQALVHHMTLEDFCSNPKCRLFNAHWQEDLIRTQVDSPRFCPEHNALITKLAKDPIISW